MYMIRSREIGCFLAEMRWMNPSSFYVCCFSGLVVQSQAQKGDAEQYCVGQHKRFPNQESWAISVHPSITSLVSSGYLVCLVHFMQRIIKKDKESPHNHKIQSSNQIFLHNISPICKTSLFERYIEGLYLNSSQTPGCYDYILESSITYASVI